MRYTLMFVLTIFLSAQSWGQEEAIGSNSHHEHGVVEWTIMAYMNGRHNGLEPAALCDFYEMLSADFAPSVSLVVQLSFDGNAPIQNNSTNAPCDEIQQRSTLVPYWRGTRRFQIKNHQALEKRKPHFDDLGDPKALAEFVKWARKKFPAEHYMLILWSHGEAVPLKLLQAGGSRPMDDQKRFPAFPEDEIAKLHALNDGTGISMYVSGTAHILLNKEIHDSLKKVLKAAKLDLIGFDACYKALIETAFAMHDVADVLVASEEATPDGGWDYHDWLPQVVAGRSLSPVELGTLIVESYRMLYQQKTGLTTESSMDLTKVECVIEQLDLLSAALIKHPELWPRVAKIRNQIVPYQFQAIDLTRFVCLLAEELRQDHAHDEIVLTLETLRLLLQSFITQPPYASQKSSMQNGSNGVAIYFPCSQEVYRHDSNFRFYDPDDANAIPFFKEHSWGRFLKTALPWTGSEECPGNAPPNTKIVK